MWIVKGLPSAGICNRLCLMTDHEDMDRVRIWFEIDLPLRFQLGMEQSNPSLILPERLPLLDFLAEFLRPRAYRSKHANRQSPPFGISTIHILVVHEDGAMHLY